MNATKTMHSHSSLGPLLWPQRSAFGVEGWAIATVLTALLGLFAVLGFCMRAMTLAPSYGSIPVELPIVSLPPKDPGLHTFKETPAHSLVRTTPVVVLTTEAFYFGALEAFTTDFADARKKFLIRHDDGEPQLEHLIDTMQKWLGERAVNEQIPRSNAMILLPSSDIPMPIVIQVIAGLQKSPFFERVVLGTGLL